METIVTWLIIFGAGLSLLAVLPVTKEIVRPILAAFGNLVVFIMTESSGWLIFGIKYIMSAHTVFFKHLVTNREEFIPEEKIAKMQRESRENMKMGDRS